MLTAIRLGPDDAAIVVRADGTINLAFDQHGEPGLTVLGLAYCLENETWRSALVARVRGKLTKETT